MTSRSCPDRSPFRIRFSSSMRFLPFLPRPAGLFLFPACPYARLLPYLPSSLFETAYGIYHELSGGSPSIRVIQRMEALAKELRSTGVLLGK